MAEEILSTVFPPLEFLSASGSDQLADYSDETTNSSFDLFLSPAYMDNSTELLPPDVLRYLCESNDAVLNLSTVQFFANLSVEADGWPPINWSTAARITFIGLLFFSSIIGNTIVVLVVFWSPNLKTSLNFYLVNLAIADLFITCICIWNHLVKNIFYNYPLGPVMCRIGSFVQASCLLGSVLTLSTLSLERVYAVLCPLRARHRHVPPLWKLATVWLISITAAAPLCALNEYREYEFPRFKERRCTYHHSPGAFSPVDGRCVRDTHTFIYFYHVLVTVLMFFLPLLVMLCAYLLIVHRLWMLQSLGESPEVANSAHLSAKKKVVRLSCSVLLCFVVCWAPLQTTILYAITAKPQSLSSPEFESTIFWVYMLAYSNSALNPILYAWFSKVFREEFRMMIGTRERRYHSSVTCRSCTRLDPPSKTSLALQSLSYSNSLRETRRPLQGEGNRVMIRYGSAYVPRTRRHYPPYGGPSPLIYEKTVLRQQALNLFSDNAGLRIENPIIENVCSRDISSTALSWKEQSQLPLGRKNETAAQAPMTEDTSEITARFGEFSDNRASCNLNLNSMPLSPRKANLKGEKFKTSPK